MTHLTDYKSKKAEIHSNFISTRSIIFGQSMIEHNTIIDPYTIIGYPVRSKTTKIKNDQTEKNSFEFAFDQASSGSRIGKYCHIRSFTTIYETTILEDYVETGTNVLIRENCHVGSGSIIGSGTILDSNVRVGKNARIQSNNFIPPKIVLGDNVFLGPGVRFGNDKYPVSSKLISVFVEDNVVIGLGAIIFPGVKIGKGSIIGAGALVTKDVDEDIVVIGSPARKIMDIDEYIIKKTKYEQ